MNGQTLPKEYARQLLIARRMIKLRKTMGIKACRILKNNNEKVSRFFERAFVRWIFNAVRKGKNPFTAPIRYEDFVCQEDIAYLCEREDDICTTTPPLTEWSWVSEAFLEIHSFKDIPSVQFRVLQSMNKILFHCTLPEGKKIEFDMPIKQYQRARSLCLKEEHADFLIMLVLARYAACGSTNNHSSVPPEVINFIGAKTELFGSPLNTMTEQYCSPFADLECMFGSLGSFFTFRFTSGVYFMNPPFDEDLMRAASLRIIEVLSSNVPITVVAVIPAWDVQSQFEFHKKVFTSKEYEALKILSGSKFLRSREPLDYRKHKFFDYYTDEHRALANCHLLVLSNTIFKMSAFDIAYFWEHVKLT